MLSPHLVLLYFSLFFHSCLFPSSSFSNLQSSVSCLPTPSPHLYCSSLLLPLLLPFSRSILVHSLPSSIFSLPILSPHLVFHFFLSLQPFNSFLYYLNLSSPLLALLPDNHSSFLIIFLSVSSFIPFLQSPFSYRLPYLNLSASISLPSLLSLSTSLPSPWFSFFPL